MPGAARLTDTTSHPGSIAGPGVETVTIEGLPAAVLGDTHACSFPGAPPHPPSPLVRGSGTVTIGGRPSVRVGDPAGCGAAVVRGSATVTVGG